MLAYLWEDLIAVVSGGGGQWVAGDKASRETWKCGPSGYRLIVLVGEHAIGFMNLRNLYTRISNYYVLHLNTMLHANYISKKVRLWLIHISSSQML